MVYSGEATDIKANRVGVNTIKKEDDYDLYDCDTTLFRMDSGMFSIFFPEDIHMPGIELKQSSTVKKEFTPESLTALDIEPEPFFPVKDADEKEKVNKYRQDYRKFRKGEARGAMGGSEESKKKFGLSLEENFQKNVGGKNNTGGENGRKTGKKRV